MEKLIKSNQSNILSFVSTLFFSVISLTISAQLPDDKINYVYIVSENVIYNFDPSKSIETDVNPFINKIQLPDGAKSCVTSSKNLNALKPGYTFYTIVNDTYYYHNGLNWVNTGHASGNVYNLNIGSTGNHLYNLSEDGEFMYLYDGKSNSKLFQKVNPSSEIAANLSIDDYGTFLIKQAKNMITNNSVITKGGNYAIVNGGLYVSDMDMFKKGTDSGNCIVFEGGKNEIAKACLKK
jgi:hypothetical protein